MTELNELMDQLASDEFWDELMDWTAENRDPVEEVTLTTMRILDTPATLSDLFTITALTLYGNETGEDYDTLIDFTNRVVGITRALEQDLELGVQSEKERNE